MFSLLILISENALHIAVGSPLDRARRNARSQQFPNHPEVDRHAQTPASFHRHGCQYPQLPDKYASIFIKIVGHSHSIEENSAEQIKS